VPELWTLGGFHIMQDSTPRKIGRVTAYATGGVLIFLGILGLLIESSKGKPSSTNCYGYVLAVALIACGTLTCIAVRSHYGGGLWSFFGCLCVAAAIARVALVWQVHMQGKHFTFPVIVYSTTAGLWGVGCYCLAWGHMRRHRKKAAPPNKSLQATAAAPSSCD
jgi:hypothetical protein